MNTIEKYIYMDKKSSQEDWNDEFGLMVIEFFEKAVMNGEINKTVKQLVDEIEVKFNQ